MRAWSRIACQLGQVTWLTLESDNMVTLESDNRLR